MPIKTCFLIGSQFIDWIIDLQLFNAGACDFVNLKSYGGPSYANHGLTLFDTYFLKYSVEKADLLLHFTEFTVNNM